jgi:hypothetical protein
VTQYPASPSHRHALLIPFILSFTFIRNLDGAIVATRYVYQLRGEKREARMPNHLRLQSDLGRLTPGIVRYTDASGATVYSSHSYQPMKGHARAASAYSLANSDFEEGFDDLPSAGPHDIVNLEAGGSEDEYWEGDGYRDHGHEDRHPPGLHDDHGYKAHDRNTPEGAISTE